MRLHCGIELRQTILWFFRRMEFANVYPRANSKKNPIWRNYVKSTEKFNAATTVNQDLLPICHLRYSQWLYLREHPAPAVRKRQSTAANERGLTSYEKRFRGKRHHAAEDTTISPKGDFGVGLQINRTEEKQTVGSGQDAVAAEASRRAHSSAIGRRRRARCWALEAAPGACRELLSTVPKKGLPRRPLPNLRLAGLMLRVPGKCLISAWGTNADDGTVDRCSFFNTLLPDDAVLGFFIYRNGFPLTMKYMGIDYDKDEMFQKECRFRPKLGLAALSRRSSQEAENSSKAQSEADNGETKQRSESNIFNAYDYAGYDFLSLTTTDASMNALMSYLKLGKPLSEDTKMINGNSLSSVLRRTGSSTELVLSEICQMINNDGARSLPDVDQHDTSLLQQPSGQEEQNFS